MNAQIKLNGNIKMHKKYKTVEIQYEDKMPFLSSQHYKKFHAHTGHKRNMSLQELRNFLYTGSSIDLTDFKSTNDLIVKLDLNVAQLVTEGKGDEIIKEIVDFYKFYLEYYAKKSANINLDSMALVLASCSKIRKNEQFSHLVYKTLIEASQTPFHLFAFIFYRKYLVGINSQPDVKIGSFSGRGLKKALNKWYNQYKDKDLLRLLTMYKHSHSWSNKDLFKLYHVKPLNEGIDFVIKYIMYGYDKVKDLKPESDLNNMNEFVKDLEDLKSVKNGSQAENLIRKHRLSLAHLPSKVRKYKEIWPALLDEMNVQEFSEQIHLFVKNHTITVDSPAEKAILTKILNVDNANLKITNPIYSCLAIRILDQMSNLSLIKAMHQTNLSDNSPGPAAPNPSSPNSCIDGIKEALWNAFKISVQHHKKNPNYLLQSKTALILEINTHMRNDHTQGLHHLNPIDTSACILLTLYSLNENASNMRMFAATDKLEKFELNDRSDLNSIETTFQKFASIEKNPSDQIFEWCLKNSESCDAFIFFLANNSSQAQIINEMGMFRSKSNKPNSKLVIINLSGRSTSATEEANQNLNPNLDLILKGWQFHYFFILNAFLHNKF